MKIRVRWSDIRNGVSGDPARSPIALAAKRDLGAQYAAAYLDPDEIVYFVGDFGDIRHVPLSKRAKEFTHRFNRGEPVAPIRLRVGQERIAF